MNPVTPQREEKERERKEGGLTPVADLTLTILRCFVFKPSHAMAGNHNAHNYL